jgi:hypothetical protein
MEAAPTRNVPDPHRWWALALLCGAFVMVILDGTIVLVALPSIGAELGFSEQGLQWVLNAYALSFGGLLLLGGRAADLLGRRRLLIAGVVLPRSIAETACFDPAATEPFSPKHRRPAPLARARSPGDVSAGPGVPFNVFDGGLTSHAARSSAASPSEPGPLSRKCSPGAFKTPRGPSGRSSIREHGHAGRRTHG